MPTLHIISLFLFLKKVARQLVNDGRGHLSPDSNGILSEYRGESVGFRKIDSMASACILTAAECHHSRVTY
jgi:hypothetical protein